ncbi:protein of unknown function [Streptantibioticus cattleyicolor NRRL 8057 = DSM 46488]|nr:protein of unknown function [Streptantibioticus cattleyicolor NRRL 8057 = DSM 46488]
MIYFLAPRCSHRRNRPTFRALLCRACPEAGGWCGRGWVANSAQELAEHWTVRDAHEALCMGPGTAAYLRTAVAEAQRRTRRAVRA